MDERQEKNLIDAVVLLLQSRALDKRIAFLQARREGRQDDCQDLREEIDTLEKMMAIVLGERNEESQPPTGYKPVACKSVE